MLQAALPGSLEPWFIFSISFNEGTRPKSQNTCASPDGEVAPQGKGFLPATGRFNSLLCALSVSSASARSLALGMKATEETSRNVMSCRANDLLIRQQKGKTQAGSELTLWEGLCFHLLVNSGRQTLLPLRSAGRTEERRQVTSPRTRV